MMDDLKSIAARAEAAYTAAGEMERNPGAFDRAKLLGWLGQLNKDFYRVAGILNQYADAQDYATARHWIGGPLKNAGMTYLQVQDLLYGRHGISAAMRRASRVLGMGTEKTA